MNVDEQEVSVLDMNAVDRSNLKLVLLNATGRWGVPGCLLAVGLSLAGHLQAAADLRRDASVEAVAQVLPSVVNIGTETIVEVRDPYDEALREFWGPYYRRRPRQAQYSLGSGVIIDEAGYVLTNNHVVRRANRIWVKLSEEGGGQEYEAEFVAGTGKSDVALVKIKAKPGERFKAVRFGADDDLLLGETVLALGNPFGLGGSVSRGILSSKSRRPPSGNEQLDVADWLQTDAAINPGNSGGPLINLQGEVIGLSVAVYREGQGIGFAIPIKRVTEALSEIFSPESQQLWFGGRIRPAGNTGLVVAQVESGSPAEKAGLRPGDRVEGINGKTPRGYIEFIQELNAAGDKKDVALVLQRGAAHPNATVRLVREASVFNAALVKRRLGLSVQEITIELAERMSLPTAEGLLVAGVDRDGPAHEAGLQQGHILLSVDGVAADKLVPVAKALYSKAKGGKVSLDILVERRRGAFIVPERGTVELPVR